MSYKGTFIDSSVNIRIENDILYADLRREDGTYNSTSIPFNPNVEYDNINGNFKIKNTMIKNTMIKIYEFEIGSSLNRVKIINLNKNFNKNNILVFQKHTYKDKFKYFFIDNKLYIERIDEDSGWNYNHKVLYHETNIEESENNKVYEIFIGNNTNNTEKKIYLDKYFNNSTVIKRESIYRDNFNFHLNNNELTVQRVDRNEPWLYNHSALIYCNNIPKNIYLCYKTKNIPDYIISSFKNLNPSYNVILYDDNDIINFLHQYYNQEYVDLFNYLKDGAIKSDFWRICVLYKLGGVYFDIDIELFESIDNFMEDGVTFLTCLSYYTNSTNPHFIISHAGNVLLAKCLDYFLDKYRRNVNYDYWEYSIVYIMANVLKDIFGEYLNNEGIYYDGNYCNKYQFLKEISDNDYSNWHCVYNNKKILNNRRKEYKISY